MRWRPSTAVPDAAASFGADAWASFRRNGLMTVAAVTTISVALLVVGSAVVIGANLARIAGVLEDQVQVVAFLRDGMGAAEAADLRSAVAALPGVAAVQFVGRDEALARLQTHLGEEGAFADLVQTNPLPDSLEVRPTDPQQAPAVARALAAQPGVSEVSYGGQVVDRLMALTRGVRIIAVLLTVFLTAVALIVVVNTIRLTIIARRQEIEIMQLVGATRWFVRWPFVIEGLLQGTTAAAAAALVVGGLYAVGALRLNATMPFLPVVPPGEAAGPLLISVLASGLGVGTAGSLIAIRRFLVS